MIHRYAVSRVKLGNLLWSREKCQWIFQERKNLHYSNVFFVRASPFTWWWANFGSIFCLGERSRPSVPSPCLCVLSKQAITVSLQSSSISLSTCIFLDVVTTFLPPPPLRLAIPHNIFSKSYRHKNTHPTKFSLSHTNTLENWRQKQICAGSIYRHTHYKHALF